MRFVFVEDAHDETDNFKVEAKNEEELLDKLNSGENFCVIAHDVDMLDVYCSPESDTECITDVDGIHADSKWNIYVEDEDGNLNSPVWDKNKILDYSQALEFMKPYTNRIDNKDWEYNYTLSVIGSDRNEARADLEFELEQAEKESEINKSTSYNN